MLNLPKIYLISPPEVELKSFSVRLERALKTGLVPFFQLRLKNLAEIEVMNIAKELQKVCRNNNCKFIINDFYQIAIDSEADGVHLGAEDANISAVRSQIGEREFLIGASCYDSRELAINAEKNGANLISFGAFFPSKTKKSRGNPSLDIIDWAKINLSVPISGIGGINSQNCAQFISHQIDYLCFISAVWDHEIGEDFAVKEINNSLLQSFFNQA